MTFRLSPSYGIHAASDAHDWFLSLMPAHEEFEVETDRAGELPMPELAHCWHTRSTVIWRVSEGVWLTGTPLQQALELQAQHLVRERPPCRIMTGTLPWLSGTHARSHQGEE